MAGTWRQFVSEVVHRVWKFVALFAGIDIAAALGFFLLQPGVSVPTAFYWSIVTLSTTGYGDVVPTTGAARALTMGILYTQIFMIAYLISVIGAVFTEETQRRQLGVLGTDMRDHIVVLGYGSIGRAAVRELIAQEQRVAVVVSDPAEVPNVRALAPESQLFVTYGAPADLDILKRVNAAAAHSVIACAEADDAENLIAALNTRSLSPRVRIVVAVQRPELRDTLRAAGVTYVASPSDMGGRMCASAAFEPEVALALEQLAAAAVAADMREYVLTPSCPIPGGKLADLERTVREATGCLVIGYARANPSGEMVPSVNPPPETELRPADALLILGTIENTHRFQRWFGAPQGR
ncbi:MAG: NAD-binding protein [Thermoplasmata archaeon]|nr:NAD-binding protein [Thermoplasmata archaeon]